MTRIRALEPVFAIYATEEDAIAAFFERMRAVLPSPWRTSSPSRSADSPPSPRSPAPGRLRALHHRQRHRRDDAAWVRAARFSHARVPRQPRHRGRTGVQPPAHATSVVELARVLAGAAARALADRCARPSAAGTSVAAGRPPAYPTLAARNLQDLTRLDLVRIGDSGSPRKYRARLRIGETAIALCIGPDFTVYHVSARRRSR